MLYYHDFAFVKYLLDGPVDLAFYNYYVALGKECIQLKRHDEQAWTDRLWQSYIRNNGQFKGNFKQYLDKHLKFDDDSRDLNVAERKKESEAIIEKNKVSDESRNDILKAIRTLKR